MISYVVNQTSSMYLKNKLPIPYKVLWALIIQVDFASYIHGASCRWYLKFKDKTTSLQFLGPACVFCSKFAFSHSWWLFLRAFVFHCLLVGLSSQREANPLLKVPCTRVWVACEPPAYRQDWPNLYCSIRQPLEFPVDAAPFAELPNTQILPDLAGFQHVCQLLGSEESLDDWEFLYAWVETAAAWLMWRQNPAPQFPVGNAVPAPCTCPIWAGRRAVREACLSWVGPESTSSRLEGTGLRLQLFFRFIST